MATRPERSNNCHDESVEKPDGPADHNPGKDRDRDGNSADEKLGSNRAGESQYRADRHIESTRNHQVGHRHGDDRLD
jgi:hypothetical protein